MHRAIYPPTPTQLYGRGCIAFLAFFVKRGKNKTPSPPPKRSHLELFRCVLFSGGGKGELKRTMAGYRITPVLVSIPTWRIAREGGAGAGELKTGPKTQKLPV
jgi:hypothetical protein